MLLEKQTPSDTTLLIQNYVTPQTTYIHKIYLLYFTGLLTYYSTTIRPIMVRRKNNIQGECKPAG